MPLFKRSKIYTITLFRVHVVEVVNIFYVSEILPEVLEDAWGACVSLSQKQWLWYHKRHAIALSVLSFPKVHYSRHVQARSVSTTYSYIYLFAALIVLFKWVNLNMRQVCIRVDTLSLCSRFKTKLVVYIPPNDRHAAHVDFMALMHSIQLEVTWLEANCRSQ